MKRREFITLLGGAAAALPIAVRAQQMMPLVAFIQGGSAEANTRNVSAFRKGFAESGFFEGQNAIVEYHWLEGRYDRLPELVADLARRRVALIATNGNVPSIAAKAVTATIPIVFGVAGNPVQLGLVESLARPGGNATGINFFSQEVVAKRLRLLHDLVPKAGRFAVLVNPTNTSNTETTLRDVKQAAASIGLQILVVNASTISEIDAAIATVAREHVDALFISPDGFFASRSAQFATLTAQNRIPAAYSNRNAVISGGLMSYGTDLPDLNRQVGIYAGKILKGAKPADLPILQSIKFEFVINVTTARLLGIDVPPDLLSIADEVIE